MEGRHSCPVSSLLRSLALALLGAAAFAAVRAQATFDYVTSAGVSPGNVDGVGAAARFRGGGGMAADASGNLYVADFGNNTIRKITAAGVVTTIAGFPGAAGTANGTGSAARFNGPAGIAVDASGTLYVAEYGNNTIRKISAAGAVTTLAGSPGHPGPSGDSADGVGAAAGFFHPTGVAVDGFGNVYVTDSGNGTIRKITPAGAVTTIAGVVGVGGTTDGTGGGALFDYPYGIMIGGTGNLYVTDFGACTIRVVTPTGMVTTLAGDPGVAGSGDGAGATARFNQPTGVASDGFGNLYVADNGSNTIRKVTPAGVVTTLAGSAAATGSSDGTGAAASFTDPYGVAVGNSGSIFVTDDTTIRAVTPGGSVTTFAGVESIGAQDGVGPAARFFLPTGLAVDGSGNTYVADSGNSTIRQVSPGGVVTTIAGAAGVPGSADGAGAAAGFNGPNGMAVDAAGNVYVADTRNNTIRKVTPAGVVTTLAGTAGNAGSADGTGAAAAFRSPYGVVLDASGNFYVTDSGNYTVRLVTPAGAVTTLAGAPGIFGSTDGAGAAAKFSGPGGIAIDRPGNLYVTDGNTIRRITPGGVVSTLAGSPGVFGSADGAGAAASFNRPLGVAADGLGNVWVADSGNNTIREIAPSGAVTTVAGVAGIPGSADGTGTAALFDYPIGLAVDGGGNLHIADNENNSIRLGEKTTAPVIDTSNAWLDNLSARAYLQGSGNLLIAGFVTTGPAAKKLLVRADGPALAGFGISDFLADPRLTLFSGPAAFDQADSWNPDLGPVFSQVGAFALAAGSHDDALVESVAPGAYTAQIESQSGGSGVVLAEIYQADAGAPANRLINISVRAQVGTGDNILVGGFVVAGTTDEALLIRAIGPALAGFGVAGTLASPVLTLFNSAGVVIAVNSGWGNPVVPGSGAVLGGPGAMALQAATSGVFPQVGAFALPSGSADCAMVVDLPPGAYTAQVSGVDGATGVGLVEIYEINP